MDIREPNTEHDWQQYYDLRRLVLRSGIGASMGSEKDNLEDDSYHLMATEGDRCIGVGRAHFNHSTEGHIRFMAVAADCRGRGIGRALMEGLEIYLLRNAAAAAVLDARKEAVGFYRKHGYEVVDETGVWLGDIEHFKMRKQLMR